MPSHHGHGSGAHSDCASPASTVSMDPRSPEGGYARSGRQRLKPWLEAQVSSGKHPGLQWIDAEKRIFRMTWKHGGRADWSEEDGSLFKAWAVHTGRFREGVDDPDWPCWKTRLRCAINKQKPDIMELKDQSCMEEPRPYRVFQFTDSRPESGPSNPPRGSVQAPEADGVDGYTSPVQNRPSVIQPITGNIPTTIDSLESKPSLERLEECLEAQMNSLGSDLQRVSIQDLLPNSNLSYTDISVASSINSYAEVMDTDSLKEAGGQAVKSEPVENADPAYQQTISNHEMTVTLRFRNEVVHQCSVVNPQGCRVFFGDMPYEHVWDPQLFGSREADQLLVPYIPGQLNQQQDQYTLVLLKGLEHGVNLEMDQCNIYVVRRCKTRIMSVPANTGQKFTSKLERRERLKVFDFAQDFLPAFQRYQQGAGPRPSPQVIVAIGQDFNASTDPYTNLFLSVTVCHAQASHLLSQLTSATSAPEVSCSDHFDQHMDMLKKENLTIPITGLPQGAASDAAFGDAQY